MTTDGNRHVRPILAIALGLGLIAAPALFQMFSRAPSGGEMIDGFTPYMTDEVITGFADDLALIDRAVAEAAPLVASLPDSVRSTYFDQLNDEWNGIYDDMGSMLDTMGSNLPNFDAVVALPPFPLFPWFFVAPGVLVVLAGVWGLRPRADRRPGVALIAFGVGLIAAPVVFQMFERAPRGADMIDDFRALMTTERVQTMQGYFLTIGTGEGNLRNDLIPALDAQQVTPTISEFISEWPRISNEMAPMIGAMSDNLDNFADVDALPPFDLFPWFFVAPGALLTLIGITSVRATAARVRPIDSTDLDKGET